MWPKLQYPLNLFINPPPEATTATAEQEQVLKPSLQTPYGALAKFSDS